MKLLIQIITLSIISVIFFPSTYGQQQASINTPEKIGVTYRYFSMKSGNNDFKILEKKLPESIEFYFLRHKTIRWIENTNLQWDTQIRKKTPDINMQRQQYSNTVKNETSRVVGAKYEVRGSFSEFDTKLDVYLELLQVETGKIVPIGMVTGSYENLSDLISEMSQKIERSVNEIEGVERKGKQIGVVCFERKGNFLNSKIAHYGEDLALALIRTLQTSDDLTVLPFNVISSYCNRRINPSKLIEELDLDALLFGNLMNEKNDLTIETFIFFRNEPEPFLIYTNTGKAYNYLQFEEKLTLNVKDFLEAAIDSSSTWNINFLKFRSDDAMEYWEEANNYASNNQIEIAIYLYNKALSLDPNQYKVYSNIALLKYQNAKYHEAISFASKSIEIEPSFPDAFLTLGNCYLMTGEYEKALEAYKRAKSIDPDDYTVWYDLGLTYLYLANYKEAIINFNHALELNPKLNEVNRYLGQAYGYIGEMEKSEMYYKRVLVTQPNDRNTKDQLNNLYTNRGVELFRNKDYDSSLNEFEKAIEFSESELNFENIRITLNRIPDFQKAEQYIELGLEKGVYTPDIYNIQGYDLRDFFVQDISTKSDYAFEAIKYFKKYSEAEPETKISAISNIGLVYDYLGDNEKAIVNYEEAYHIARENRNMNEAFMAMNNLADLYFEANDFDKAIFFNSEILEVEPNFLVSYVTLSNSYILNGDYKQARNKIGTLVELLNNQEITKLDINRPKWWWKTDDEVIFIESDEMKMAFALHKLAFTQFLNENVKEAKRVISKVRKLNVDSKDSIEKLITHEFENYILHQPSLADAINEFKSSYMGL